MSLEGCQLGYYQLLHQIGRGGMGVIYLAQDTHLPRQVAVKVMRTDAELYDNSTTAQKKARLFQREVQTIAQLDHPHILPVFDSGEQSIYKFNYIYLAMPYRPEGSLSGWLHQRQQSRPLSLQEVGILLTQAASALQYAHDKNIVHQDVKPSNFLLRASASMSDQDYSLPDLLLADFGMARLLNADSSMLQDIGGTPFYMAPEQWESQPVPASDQYALAVMAFLLLTSQLPFQGTPGQVMYQHHTAQPPAPSSLNPQLSSAIDAVIARALSKQAEQRFPSIKDFAQAFVQAQIPEQFVPLAPLQNQPVQGDPPTLPNPEQIPTQLYNPPVEEAVILSASAQLEPSSSSASTDPTTLQQFIDRPRARKKLSGLTRSLLIGMVALLILVGSGILLLKDLQSHNHLLQTGQGAGAAQGPGSGTATFTSTSIVISSSVSAHGQQVTPGTTPALPGKTPVPPSTTPAPPGATSTPPVPQVSCATSNWAAYFSPVKGKTFLDPASNLVISSNCHNAVLVKFPQLPSDIQGLTVKGCINSGSCGSWISVTAPGTWINLKSMPPGTQFWLEITYTDTASSGSTFNIAVEY